MNAMILAAGLGTRMAPHSDRLPKPLFPVVDKTLLELSIDSVIKAGASKIVVNVFHHAQKIERFIKERSFDAEVIVSRETEIMGTAGGIMHAREWLIDGGDFIVINSDIIAGPSWSGLIERHKATDAIATLALLPNSGAYSALAVNEDGLITKFPGATGPDHVDSAVALMFSGVSIMSPSIFDLIPAGRAVDISTEIYTPMTEKGSGLYGFVSDFPWRDAGTVENYRTAVTEALRAMPGIENWVYIEAGAVIGAGVDIGPNVAVHEGAIIGAGASVNNSVVLPGSVIGEGEIVEERVV